MIQRRCTDNKRIRAAAACLACKRRRSKCDTNQIVCIACKSAQTICQRLTPKLIAVQRQKSHKTIAEVDDTQLLADHLCSAGTTSDNGLSASVDNTGASATSEQVVCQPYSLIGTSLASSDEFRLTEDTEQSPPQNPNNALNSTVQQRYSTVYAIGAVEAATLQKHIHSGLSSIEPSENAQKAWMPDRQQIPLLFTAFVQQLIFLPVIGLVQLVEIVDTLYVYDSTRRTADMPDLLDPLHDCFILAIGSAIGASVLYRRLETKKFYKKAREFFDLQPRYGLERLQEMILLAMFKLLEPEIAMDLDLCALMHTTVTYILALGIHKETVCKSSASPNSCRRIFWCAYALDRKVSLANKLPLSLKDEDVTVEYFSNESEPPLFQMLADESRVTDEQLGRIPFNCKSWNLSLSRQLIRLTRITSATLSLGTAGSLTDRLAQARALHSRLDRWRLAIKQHHDSSAQLDPITCLPRGPMLERIRTHCELEYHEHLLHIYVALIGELLYAVPTLICLTSASTIIRLIGQMRQRLIPLSIPISRLVFYAATVMIQSYSECEKSGQESLSIYTIHSIMSDTGCAIRSLEMFKDEYSGEAISRLSAARESLQWVEDNQTINENLNHLHQSKRQGIELTELDVNPFAILDVDFFPGWTMAQ